MMLTVDSKKRSSANDLLKHEIGKLSNHLVGYIVKQQIEKYSIKDLDDINQKGKIKIHKRIYLPKDIKKLGSRLPSKIYQKSLFDKFNKCKLGSQ